MKLLYFIIPFFWIQFSLADDKESFRSLIKELIQHDPAFKEIDLQTPVFDAQLKQGFSKLVLPKVSLSYGHYEQNTNASFISNDEYKVGSLTTSFDLFSFGSDWSNFQSSRYQKKAQDYRVTNRLLERESEITFLVLNYLREAKNVEILNKIVELKTKALSVSQRRYQRGTLSEEDFNKVKLDVSNARGELLVNQQTYNFALAKVKAYGVKNLPSHYPWEQDLTSVKIEELKELSAPVTQLPQFLEADLTEIASDYQKNAFRSLMFGKVQLNFSRTLYDFEETNQWEWRTSLVYTLPLFDSFDQYTAFKQNDVQQRINQVRKRFRKSEAAANQEAEKVNLEVSWKNWVERREALKLSSKLYNGSLAQFNQGKLSVNELFVDQDRLLRTELIANLALHQLHGSVIAFCHSRGKAFVRGCF